MTEKCTITCDFCRFRCKRNFSSFLGDKKGHDRLSGNPGFGYSEQGEEVGDIENGNRDSASRNRNNNKMNSQLMRCAYSLRSSFCCNTHSHDKHRKRDTFAHEAAHNQTQAVAFLIPTCLPDDRTCRSCKLNTFFFLRSSQSLDSILSSHLSRSMIEVTKSNFHIVSIK